MMDLKFETAESYESTMVIFSYSNMCPDTQGKAEKAHASDSHGDLESEGASLSSEKAAVIARIRQQQLVGHSAKTNH